MPAELEITLGTATHCYLVVFSLNSHVLQFSMYFIEKCQIVITYE